MALGGRWSRFCPSSSTATWWKIPARRCGWPRAIRTPIFLTPEGECFHNATVTGGKPASEGPLALKRELREAEGRLAKLESGLAQAETEAAALIRDHRRAGRATGSAQRRAAAGRARHRQPGRGAEADGEPRRSASSGACRSGRRRPRATRTRARPRKPASTQKREEMLRLEAEHRTAEAALDELQAQLALLRQKRESVAAGGGAGDRGTGRPGGAAARRGGGLPAHRPASLPTWSAAC